MQRTVGRFAPAPNTNITTLQFLVERGTLRVSFKLDECFVLISERQKDVPTYSYECRKCGHVQDVFHPMAASPRVVCTECRARCRKLFGMGAGIIFKGAGFYETDYRRKSEPSTCAQGFRASDGGKTADKADKKDKAESKPAAASGGEPESTSASKKDV